MKRTFTLLAGLLIVVAIFSQTPQRISYQAVIRDNNNQLVTSQQVGIRISILWGSADGSVVYSETQTPETNHSGLIGIEIGGGTGFSSIDWSTGPYFIKTETDPSGGIDYTITGISQLLTVPYALHAKTAENISGGISIDYSELTGTPVLSTVAESGNYNDLMNTPDLAGIALSGEYNELIGAPALANIATSGSFNDVGDKPSTLSGYGITDAMSTLHAANGITSVDITSWNAAYSWGDHSAPGYLTGIASQPLGDLVDVDLTGLDAGNVLKYDLVQGKWIVAEDQGVISETDPAFNSSVSSGIVAGDIENWNTAHLWGDHSAEGYLTSESDPLFTTWDKTTGITITESQISDLQSYLTAEADPVFSAHSASGIVSVGSGNVISVEERSKLTGIEAGANNYVHPGTHPASMVVEEVDLRFMTDAERTKLAAVEAEANKYIHPGTHPASMVVEEVDLRFMNDAERTKLEGIEAGAQVNVKGDWNAVAGSDAEILNKPALANIATSGSFNDVGDKPSTLSGYGITDAMSTLHAANGITSVDITSWNAAYSWGDHSAKGYLTSESDPVFSAHSASGIVSVGSGNVISVEERSKLTGIEAGANNYVHPGTHPASMVVEEIDLRFMNDAERTKLSAVEAEANKYIHPGTHPASMVVEEIDLRFMNDAERTKLEGIEAGAQVNVKGDWNAVAGSDAEILNKPALANIATSGSFNDVGDKPSTLSGYGITDAMSTLHAANGITSVDITSWNAAYSWGDHSASGYLTGITGQLLGDLADVDLTGLDAGNVLKFDLAQGKWIVGEDKGITSETDPVFNSSVSSGIVAGDIENWNTAHLWGDHSAEGYLTSESDPVFTAWDKTTGITITESQISDLKAYLTVESDPAVAANFDFSSAAIGDLLIFNGTKWVKHTPDYAASGHTHGNATNAADGFMSAADKTKLDGLQNSDGSETNIIAGDNIAVSGSGTASDPYVVNVDTVTRYIGEEYGGGIVFYVTPDGKHGLVAAKQDQTLSGAKRWYDAQNVISDPANHDAEGENYTDWRLPTLNELRLLYDQKAVVGGFGTGVYWSSTEYSYGQARYKRFADGYQYFNHKTTTYLIRAVRSF